MTSNTHKTIQNTGNLLTVAELSALDIRLAANAERWLEKNLPITKSKSTRKPKTNRGPKPKVLQNPFFGFIGRTTVWGRYPVFALDVMEGVIRLDWHNRVEGVGGKSTPLALSRIIFILESLPLVSNEKVADLLQLGERHARRYFKAIEIILPAMMAARPNALIEEMDHTESDPKPCKWEDRFEACPPSAETLEKLHYDLRTLTQYKTAEEYDAEMEEECFASKPIPLVTRQQHPRRAEVAEMLAGGMGIKLIERQTGVAAKTIRRWRDETLAAQVEQRAA
ncbi:helix-turn-helix domain-containing protein [Pseudomonas juntendi]|uniref:helix-turn-helix domain-containing protein n=1 Tax=Pseudomonas juntendi TaxID=2666183 RepID=UPI002447C397|nr:helix-turn-helix domain-containing protein [Pseudomonas juntendi]MDH1551565.1 helix-turn-helix domain-containing protein [Pseudomonas juntendi]